MHGWLPLASRYSLGIRQKVAALFASEPNTTGGKGSKAQDGVVVESKRQVTYGRDVRTPTPFFI